MTIFDTLKNEHEQVREIFSKIMEQKQKDHLFDQLNTALDVHMEGEEKYVYPVLKSSGLKEPTLESYEEHHVARIIQAELEMMSGEEENFEAKMKVFRENVEHHIQEEEGRVFPEAEEKVAKGKLEKMEKEYMKLRREKGMEGE